MLREPPHRGAPALRGRRTYTPDDKDTVQIEEHYVDVMGLRTRYLAAGSGRPLVLLHALGENATDWRWVAPDLARTYRVLAPDLPSAGPWRGARADYSPPFLGRFTLGFLDALGIEEATLGGNSLGGLAAMNAALGAPSRVPALVLVASSGLGRTISPGVVTLSTPGVGELGVAWGSTALGALQRTWSRVAVLFARSTAAPAPWILEQYRLAQQPGFLRSVLASLRAQVGVGGQRQVLLDRLPELAMPTLVLWGDRDWVVPPAQGREAVRRLPRGRLEILPRSGHVPHIERPTRFLRALRPFLAEHA